MKRSFDLVLSVALMIPAILLIIPAAFVVWIETGASPLFRQRRVGRNMQPFTLIKLRTMNVRAPQGGSHEVGSAHLLRSGAWLRRVKLDELPQLWNVLVGNMSFVGPRPCLFSQIELIEARRAKGVYGMLPGITGPAQVAGVDMSTPLALADLDATYSGTWSLKRDLALIAATVGSSGRRDAASIDVRGR